jgi:hypothetical protein
MMGKEQPLSGLKWFDDGADNSEFMVALNKVRRLATREGYFSGNDCIYRPVCGSRYGESRVLLE